MLGLVEMLNNKPVALSDRLAGTRAEQIAEKLKSDHQRTRSREYKKKTASDEKLLKQTQLLDLMDNADKIQTRPALLKVIKSAAKEIKRLQRGLNV